MRIFLSMLLLVPFLAGCITPVNTANVSNVTSTKGELAARKTCEGTVKSAHAKPSTEPGFACSTADCNSSHAVGTKLIYTCSASNRCPISTSGTNGRASCTTGGQTYASACSVTFSAVTRCR